MSSENKVALVIGANGATGTPLVLKLLEDPDFSCVKIFVRRNVSLNHPKLKIHVIDFEHLDTYRELISGDVLFSALGTTIKDAKTKEAQKKVDYDYQYQFAKIAKENGIYSLILVSSTGANPHDKFFYYRLKGELDRDVKNLSFSQTLIFRPPLLIRPYSTRSTERLLVRVFTFLNQLGLFKSQTPLKVEDLAQSMIQAFKTKPLGYTIIEKEEIKTLL